MAHAGDNQDTDVARSSQSNSSTRNCTDRIMSSQRDACYLVVTEENDRISGTWRSRGRPWSLNSHPNLSGSTPHPDGDRQKTHQQLGHCNTDGLGMPSRLQMGCKKDAEI